MVLPAAVLGVARVAGSVAQVAGRVGSTAAKAGSSASKVGSAATRVGSATEGAASTLSKGASTASKVHTGTRLATQGGRELSHTAHNVTSSQPNSRMVHQASGADPRYGYNNGAPNSPQQFDPHYGMAPAPMHSGYSGLDSAEATTGVPIRRDGFQTPAPLGANTLGSQAEMMAWKSKPQFIGTYMEFGEKKQGAAFQRPQG